MNRLEYVWPASRLEYEEFLNELGIPENDKRSNGGRVPPSTIHYGTWLRANDPIAFNVGFNEYAREGRAK